MTAPAPHRYGTTFPELPCPIPDVLGQMGPSAKWWAVKVRRDLGANGELKAACDLHRNGAQVYAPIESYTVKRAGHPKEIHHRPVVRAYIFVAVESIYHKVELSERDWKEHRRVAKWIETDNQQQVLEDMRVLTEAARLREIKGDHREFAPGETRVEIKRGTFKHWEGLVESVEDSGTVWVLIKTLGRMVPIAFQRGDIEKI